MQARGSSFVLDPCSPRKASQIPPVRSLAAKSPDPLKRSPRLAAESLFLPPPGPSCQKFQAKNNPRGDAGSGPQGRRCTRAPKHASRPSLNSPRERERRKKEIQQLPPTTQLNREALETDRVVRDIGRDWGHSFHFILFFFFPPPFFLGGGFLFWRRDAKAFAREREREATHQQRKADETDQPETDQL